MKKEQIIAKLKKLGIEIDAQNRVKKADIKKVTAEFAPAGYCEECKKGGWDGTTCTCGKAESAKRQTKTKVKLVQVKPIDDSDEGHPIDPADAIRAQQKTGSAHYEVFYEGSLDGLTQSIAVLWTDGADPEEALKTEYSEYFDEEEEGQE